MGQSVLVFVSHSSEDKVSLVEPIVRDLESCYINVWLDKRKILPGDNLRNSIFRDGLDKADVALIFFTEKSLKSSWVDREIKHVLREEGKKGNQFDLSKIISIFDSQETYAAIQDRYPELTDDLLHLMPENYTKTDLGQLISAIWSKYLSLQGGDTETQRQLLAKDREIFQKDKDISALKASLEAAKEKNPKLEEAETFEKYLKSGKLKQFIANKDYIFSRSTIIAHQIPDAASAGAFGIVENAGGDYLRVSEKGKRFFEWLILEGKIK